MSYPQLGEVFGDQIGDRITRGDCSKFVEALSPEAEAFSSRFHSPLALLQIRGTFSSRRSAAIWGASAISRSAIRASLMAPNNSCIFFRALDEVLGLIIVKRLEKLTVVCSFLSAFLMLCRSSSESRRSPNLNFFQYRSRLSPATVATGVMKGPPEEDSPKR